MNSSPVTDADLHAFLDGELPPERHRAVEAWLAAHPDARRRLESFREQQRALRRMFAPVLDEPLPEALIQASRPPAAAPRGRPRRPWLQLVAGVLMTCTGVAGGWIARGQQDAVGMAAVVPLPRQAAVAHVVFSPDVKRPVEIRAEHE